MAAEKAPIIRAFYSSPFRAYAGTRKDAIRQAMLGVLRTGWEICLAIDAVKRAERSCVWSPLIQGETMRSELEVWGAWTDREAEVWCLDCLRLGWFNALIKADSIPRRPGAESFCDEEERVARELGYRIISATDIEMGSFVP